MKSADKAKTPPVHTMPGSASERARKLADLAAADDTEGFETLWLESIDDHLEDISVFMSGIEALESSGNTSRAGLYLSMLVGPLLEKGLLDEVLLVLDKMVTLAPGEPGLRENLLQAFRRRYADLPHLETYIRKSGIEEARDLRKALDQLKTFLAFEVDSYLYHPAGWGAGRIAAVDPENATVVIDFKDRPGHRMAMDMASKVTEPISPDDLRALKLDRMEELQRMLEEDRAEVVRAALRSRRGKATQRELRDRLTDGLIDPKQWSRWWTKAKQAVKAAADISITPGSHPTLELKKQEVGFPQACLRNLAHLKTDPRRVKYFRDLIKEAAEHEQGEEAIIAVVGALAGPGEDAADLEMGSRISFAWLLQDAARRFPGFKVPSSLEPHAVLADHDAAIEHLPEIPISAHRLKTLEFLRQESHQEWPELARRIILRGEADTAEASLQDLVAHGMEDHAQKILDTIVERYREYPLAFAWYAKTAATGRFPSRLRILPPPTILEKTLILHNHLEVATGRLSHGDDPKRVTKLLNTLLLARSCGLVRNAFESAALSEGQNLRTLLRNNRSLSREIRDKVLGTMYRVRPELARTDKTASDAPSGTVIPSDVIYATEAALLRKQKEYEHLVNVLIPENAADIGRAADHGDLSENSEWTAAIEKQGQLATLSRQMQQDLDRVRLIEPSMQDGETVSLGSKVTIENEKGEEITYTILGPWDVDAEKGIISYESPLGQALLGKARGDRVEVDAPSGIIVYTVKEIADGLEATARETAS